MKRPYFPAFDDDTPAPSSGRFSNSRAATSGPDIRHAKLHKSSDPLRCSRTKSSTAAIVCQSLDPLPVHEAVRDFDGELPMTILSGASDQSAARNQISGHGLRKFFYEGQYAKPRASHNLLRLLPCFETPCPSIFGLHGC